MPAPVNTTRQNLYYLALAKQAGFGTPNAPTIFLPWLDGTDLNPERKVNREREGDTSPHISLVYVSEQHWIIKIVHYVRPIYAGYILQALLGTGSDSYTAPTTNTTLAATTVAGATTVSSTANLGNTGILVVNVSPATVNYEVATLDLTTRTGTGPWVYSLAAAGTLKNAHTSADGLTSVSTHVLTRGLSTFDPYTIEGAFSLAGFGKAQRIQDCVCTEVKILAETGKLVRFESSWLGSLSVIQAALLTPTYEGTNIVGKSGSPLHYNMAGSSWSVDGSTSNNAAQIKKFELTLKNTTGADEFQTEGLSPTYFLPENFEIDGMLECVFTNYQQFAETYYNATTLATNATDSYVQGYGAFNVTFTEDAVNSLALALPNIAYLAAKLNPPKLDAKALMQNITFTAQRTPTALVPFTATLNNSLASSY